MKSAKLLLVINFICVEWGYRTINYERCINGSLNFETQFPSTIASVQSMRKSVTAKRKIWSLTLLNTLLHCAASVSVKKSPKRNHLVITVGRVVVIVIVPCDDVASYPTCVWGFVEGYRILVVNARIGLLINHLREKGGTIYERLTTFRHFYQSWSL